MKLTSALDFAKGVIIEGKERSHSSFAIKGALREYFTILKENSYITDEDFDNFLTLLSYVDDILEDKVSVDEAIKNVSQKVLNAHAEGTNLSNNSTASSTGSSSSSDSADLYFSTPETNCGRRTC